MQHEGSMHVHCECTLWRGLWVSGIQLDQSAACSSCMLSSSSKFSFSRKRWNLETKPTPLRTVVHPHPKRSFLFTYSCTPTFKEKFSIYVQLYTHIQREVFYLRTVVHPHSKRSFLFTYSCTPTFKVKFSIYVQLYTHIQSEVFYLRTVVHPHPKWSFLFTYSCTPTFNEKFSIYVQLYTHIQREVFYLCTVVHPHPKRSFLFRRSHFRDWHTVWWHWDLGNNNKGVLNWSNIYFCTIQSTVIIYKSY